MIFARTKIQPPRFRVGLIERGELEQQFGEALLGGHRLVLLVAPAGYGKTAALSRQLSLLPPDCATAWVKADSEDDLERLLSYLIESLEPCDPPWRVAPEALVNLAATGPGLREAAAVVAGTLAATEVKRGVIAIDDLHSVADPRVCEFLSLLLDDMPENWTIAIATRVDPLLPLPRLRRPAGAGGVPAGRTALQHARSPAPVPCLRRRQPARVHPAPVRAHAGMGGRADPEPGRHRPAVRPRPSQAIAASATFSTTSRAKSCCRCRRNCTISSCAARCCPN